jgi:hypothetical protein
MGLDGEGIISLFADGLAERTWVGTMSMVRKKSDHDE